MMERDRNKFRFRCQHDHDPEHNHKPIEFAPETVLRVAAVSASIIPGMLEASQAGHDDGVVDIPLAFMRIVNADDKAHVFLIDPEMAVTLGTELITWGLLAELPDMVDDAD